MSERMSEKTSEKTAFYKTATVMIDSREKEIGHLLTGFESLGVKTECGKLDIGDLSFRTPTRDFSLSCAIERKASPDELYANITEKSGRANRFEKELDAACRSVKQFVLLVEGVAGWEALRAYRIPAWQMKTMPQRVQADIGAVCHAALRAWQAANRYDFRVEFVADKADTARRVMDEFYYFHRNYKGLIAPRR